MKRIISLFLILCLLTASVAAWAESPEMTDGEQKVLERLAQVLEKDAERLLAASGEIPDLYTDLLPSSPAGPDSFPEKFDLRERGIVTPVKSQAPWGTCWTFGTSAACETSLLSMMNLTADEYREKYGVEMDISERHLAWFTAIPLPEVSDYPEGEYPYTASQAGEGARRPEGTYPLVLGGSYLMSASSLAAGIGVVAASLAPYESNDGTEGREGDWSLPEELRFVQSFQLKNTNVLPSPAGTDAEGNYVYRPEATAAIKRELLKGRGVAAAYTAGSGSPPLPREEQRANYEESLSFEDISAGDKEALIGILLGDIRAETLLDDQLRRIVQVRCTIYGIEEGTYSLSDLPHEDLALLAGTGSNMLGNPPDEIRRIVAEEEEKQKLFFIGENPVVWAQYTKTRTNPDHATCIIGWDDTFPAASYPEGHRPPGDGAWICRNSYSSGWGMEGYFYLSYYDRSFGMPQTFEFEDDETLQKLETFGILQLDYMPAEMISATLYDAPVYAANVFTVGKEQTVLRAVSAMTGEPDTKVTISVWLLKEDAASPTDGTLLASVTDTFAYAGYHRLDLAESLPLQEGARIGITVLQRVTVGNKEQYALVSTSSRGENNPKVLEEKGQEGLEFYTRWFVGKVNPGESYVSFEEGRWLDWRAVLDRVSGEGKRACIAYDNLPVKGYVYSQSEITAITEP